MAANLYYGHTGMLVEDGTDGVVIPNGIIVIWDAEKENSIPPGWVICNGSNGTPVGLSGVIKGIVFIMHTGLQ